MAAVSQRVRWMFWFGVVALCRLVARGLRAVLPIAGIVCFVGVSALWLYMMEKYPVFQSVIGILMSLESLGRLAALPWSWAQRAKAHGLQPAQDALPQAQPAQDALPQAQPAHDALPQLADPQLDEPEYVCRMCGSSAHEWASTNLWPEGTYRCEICHSTNFDVL